MVDGHQRERLLPQEVHVQLRLLQNVVDHVETLLCPEPQDVLRVEVLVVLALELLDRRVTALHQMVTQVNVALHWQRLVLVLQLYLVPEKLNVPLRLQRLLKVVLVKRLREKVVRLYLRVICLRFCRFRKPVL